MYRIRDTNSVNQNQKYSPAILSGPYRLPIPHQYYLHMNIGDKEKVATSYRCGGCIEFIWWTSMEAIRNSNEEGYESEFNESKKD
jgi:hypothetical protein